MSLALDIIAVVILAACLFTGYKHGFIKTVYKLVGAFVALIVALIFSAKFSDYVASTAVFKKIVASLYSKVDGLLPVTDGAVVTESSFSDSALELFSKLGVSIKDIGEYVTSLVNSGKENIADGVKNYVLAPAVDSLAYAIAFILLFVLSMLALRILCAILDGAFKVTGLGGVNRFFGLLLGGGAGFIYVLVFCWIVTEITPYLAASGFKIDKEVIANTHIFKYISEIKIGALFGA